MHVSMVVNRSCQMNMVLDAAHDAACRAAGGQLRDSNVGARILRHDLAMRSQLFL